LYWCASGSREKSLVSTPTAGTLLLSSITGIMLGKQRTMFEKATIQRPGASTKDKKEDKKVIKDEKDEKQP